MEFDLQGAVGTMDSSLTTLRAEIKLKPLGGWPVMSFDLNGENLRQRWIAEPDLRLWLHQDVDGNEPVVDLVLMTKQTSETDFSGRYRITVKANGKERKHAGRVTCVMG